MRGGGLIKGWAGRCLDAVSGTSGILGSEVQVVGLRVEGGTVVWKGLLGSNMRILEWRVEWFDLRYTEAI